jgi:hypothetical protein
MVRTALVILAIELVVIYWVRHASRARERGEERRQQAATGA